MISEALTILLVILYVAVGVIIFLNVWRRAGRND